MGQEITTSPAAPRDDILGSGWNFVFYVCSEFRFQNFDFCLDVKILSLELSFSRPPPENIPQNDNSDQ